jgi:iron transport multicopper oxidase
MSSGADSVNPAVYGQYSHAFVLGPNSVVDIVVNNQDSGKHPFHLHGHNFQAIWRSDGDAGDYNSTTDINFPATPMRRDTMVVMPNGNIVLRFRADNPGVWLFHCHIEWHVDSGLIATIVEAPLSLQQNLRIPTDHIAACQAAGTPYTGNAAGNTVNLLDLSGENAPPDPLPAG